jgi:murein DD-endopeptidase MepM/ murein hydrolase activator NlpD
VLEVSDRYPDEFASNPQEHFSKRIERLKQHLIEKGVGSDNIQGGNYVFIDHENGEYARYCHLLEEIPVKAGDRVAQGDVIGYVGNSGQSMEPHLHLELLDSPDIYTANGLPIVFSNLDLSRALDSPSFGEKNSFAFSEFIFVFSD